MLVRGGEARGVGVLPVTLPPPSTVGSRKAIEMNIQHTHAHTPDGRGGAVERIIKAPNGAATKQERVRGTRVVNRQGFSAKTDARRCTARRCLQELWPRQQRQC